jgi:hypothetical protein
MRYCATRRFHSQWQPSGVLRLHFSENQTSSCQLSPPWARECRNLRKTASTAGSIICPCAPESALCTSIQRIWEHVVINFHCIPYCFNDTKIAHVQYTFTSLKLPEVLEKVASSFLFFNNCNVRKS